MTMNPAVPNIDQLIKEFKDEINFINHFLTKTSSLKPGQETMLRNRARAIEHIYNQLALNPKTPPKLFFETLIEIIPLLEKIYLSLSPVASPLTYLEYYSIYLLCLVEITSLLGESIEYQLLGIAHALVAVLSGINIADPTKFLVPEEHPEYYNRYALVFNILNLQYALFSNLLSNLYDISYEDYIIWSKNAIESAFKLLRLLDSQWDVIKLYNLQKSRKSPRPFFLFTFHVTVPFNIIETLMVMLSLNKKEIPEELKPNPFGITNENSFKKTITSLFARGQERYNELMAHVKSKAFDLNDNPDNDPDLLRIRDFVTDFNNILQGFFYIEKHLQESNDNAIPVLEEIINNILQVLRKKQSLFQEKTFISTVEGEEYYFIIRCYLTIIGYYAVTTKNISIFREFLKLTSCFFTESSLKKFPGIGGIKYLVLLTIASSNIDLETYKEAINGLEKIIAFYQFKPRDYISYQILITISKIILGEKNINAFIELKETITEELMKTNYVLLQEEILEYLECIEQALNGKEPSYSLSRLSFKDPFDPTSLFIPDLNSIREAVNSQHRFSSLIYIPFNMISDSLRKAKYFAKNNQIQNSS